eukprot:gene6949-9503_t
MALFDRLLKYDSNSYKNWWIFPISSRLLALILCFLFDYILDDHTPSGVMVSINTSSYLKAFTRWDAVHYLTIAKNGYTEEFQYAFLPLYPAALYSLTRVSSNFITMIYPGHHLTTPLMSIESMIILGLLLNNTLFVINSYLLKLLFESWHIDKQ